MRNISAVSTMVAAAVLSACVATLPPGKDYLSADEIADMVSGKTWVWDNGVGGLYFQPDGTAFIRFEGDDHETTWSTERGKFCYAGPKSSSRCWALYREDGNLKSFSLWQPEHRTPYIFKPAERFRSGRVFR